MKKCKDCKWFVSLPEISMGICDCPLPMHLDIDDNYYVNSEDNAASCGIFDIEEN